MSDNTNSKELPKLLKIYLRSRFPELYGAMLRLVTSAEIRNLRSFPSRNRDLKKIRENYPRFPVKIETPMGMGAMLTHSLRIFAYCKANSLIPELIFTNPLYAPASAAGEIPSSNWSAIFFDGPACSNVEDLSNALTFSQTVDNIISKSTLPSTAAESNILFFSYLQFNKRIIQLSENLSLQLNIDEYTLGVHYRGTDKRFEAERIDWDIFIYSIQNTLSKGQFKRIFLATDEPEFADYLKTSSALPPICEIPYRHVHRGSQPAHTTPGDGKEKGDEALTTMILLSKCRTCVRTPSHLSAWAKILSPSIELVTIGKTKAGDQLEFPEILFTRCD